jgi:urease accessory protein
MSRDSPIARSFLFGVRPGADVLLNPVRWGVIAASLFLFVDRAAAYHLMGGKVPSTLIEGILSGLGHPIIGPDHLAFLLALGIAVGVFRLSFVNPLLFIVAMSYGVAVHLAAVTIPGAELIVSISVLVAGIMLVSEGHFPIPAGWWMAMVIAAGFFHGYSYGESIIGAEPSPLAAYLAGLVAVQTLLTVGVASATRELWKMWSVAPRLAGAAICGVGFTALVARLIPLY